MATGCRIVAGTVNWAQAFELSPPGLTERTQNMPGAAAPLGWYGILLVVLVPLVG